jgi:hypothetical protein
MVVSSILIIIAGVVLFLKVPTLQFMVYFFEQGGVGQGLSPLTNIPIFPAFLILFGMVSIFLAYRMEGHLSLLAYVNLGVMVTLILFWLQNDTEFFLYIQDYGAPVGWLTQWTHPLQNGIEEGWGVDVVEFLISAGFWSVIVGTPFVAKRGKSLLSVGFILGAIGYFLSIVFYFVQIVGSMFWTIQGFSFLGSFLDYINSITSSALLYKYVLFANETTSPLAVGIMAFFYFTGFIGVVLTYLALHLTKDGTSSYRAGMIGGALMIIGSTLLFGFIGGIFAIMGAVESKQEPNIKEGQ